MSSGSNLVNTALNTAEKGLEGALSSVIGAGPTSALTGILGFAGGSATDWVTELKDWIVNSGFFQRLALAVLAFIFILGALYLIGRDGVSDTISKVAKG